MNSAIGLGYPLSVICLSLGGTKVEIGVLTRDETFFSSPEFYWRESPQFAEMVNDINASRFCDALARWVSNFLGEHGYILSDVRIIGMPFPGPKDGELWYSNNLIRAFQQGVALEREMADALSRLSSTKRTPSVRVIFDAQCDAGGELFHPAGRFSSQSSDTPPLAATVLNIATGIAAGFIKEGRVLVSDEDFQAHVNREYDGGAGQLGRHLLYHPDESKWEYRFQPHGRTPDIAGSATRMTERLSGPALAARLLLQLGNSGLLDARAWTVSDIPFSEIEELYRLLASLQDIVGAAQAIRGTSRPVAGALLGWADDVYYCGAPSVIVSCIHRFTTEVAAELAAALCAWMSAPGWASFGKRIVLTGGAGIHFLASSDAVPAQSFLRALESALPIGCRVERSRLLRATERECYLFIHQPMLRAEYERHRRQSMRY